MKWVVAVLIFIFFSCVLESISSRIDKLEERVYKLEEVCELRKPDEDE